MKKAISLLLATCIIVMTGCSSLSTLGSTDKIKPTTDVLTDKGLELISKVDKLAECQEYTNLYTVDDEIESVIKGIAGNDYAYPQGVFTIENTDTVVLENMMPDTKLPEDIAKMVKGRFGTALPTLITAMNGATAIAATSILSYGESFIYEGLQSSITYLYTYGNEYGFMVSYNPNDENIVNASITVVISDELSECTSKEEVLNYFNDTLFFESLVVSAVTLENE